MSMQSDGMSPEDRADLEFLRDEGLELLALFKRIKNPADRDKVREMARSLAGPADTSIKPIGGG